MIFTIKKIRGLCTESSFERGLEYFNQGYVDKIEQVENEITAIVIGTEPYKVSIRINKEDFTANCSCPYDWGGYCKHIIATLIDLSKNYKVIKKIKNKEKSKIDDILNSVTLEELKEFLKAEFNNNSELKRIFAIHFSGKELKDKSIHDYRKEISMLYRYAVDHYGFVQYGNNIDFSKIQELAQRLVKKGNLLEAIKIYQALSESIAENMDNVDDSMGYYGDEFRIAIEDYVNTIIKVNFKHKEKKRYINYLFNKYIENNPDYFQEYYDYALREICQSEYDLNYWKEIFSPYLPDTLPDKDGSWTNYYNAKKNIDMQLFILDKLNKKEEFYKLVRKHYRQDHEFCLLYAERLKKDGLHDQSLAVAEEGLEIFPEHLTSSLRIFLNTIYKQHFPEKYKENLKKLFLYDGDWEYYYKLKKKCTKPEWEKLIQEIITYFSSGDRYNNEYRVIDIYLKENRTDKAFEKVIAIKSLKTLDHYYKELSKKYPNEYFHAYKDLIIPFTDSRMGRNHYKNIVYYLERMKNIGVLKNDFNKFVEMLKEKYNNRPAFLDEMSRI